MMLHAEEKVAGAGGFRRIFRTLAYKNYRLFFIGQSISLIGTWMQRVAMSWLVYHLTDSEFLLGLVSFLGLIPVFVLSPFAGVLADRLHRLHLLIATQVLAMLQAILLATLVITGHIRIGHLMLLYIVGFGLMVQMASSNTILQSIVDDDKRGRVMSFYVMGVMGTTPIGSLLAGAAAARLGTPETLIIGGGCCLAGALLFTLKLRAIREIMRPIYIEKGIISEVALGLQAAAQWPKPPAG
jgi:MFS family permease